MKMIINFNISITYQANMSISQIKNACLLKKRDRQGAGKNIT
jgi:hypothetical protein